MWGGKVICACEGGLILFDPKSGRHGAIAVVGAAASRQEGCGLDSGPGTFLCGRLHVLPVYAQVLSRFSSSLLPLQKHELNWKV